jgi:hypothetical protein
MKSLRLALIGMLMVFKLGAFAQNPSKGYYSIKGKTEQLPTNRKPARYLLPQTGYPFIAKGYYSMRGHEKQLPQKLQLFLAPVERESKKGYYSIPRKQ